MRFFAISSATNTRHVRFSPTSLFLTTLTLTLSSGDAGAPSTPIQPTISLMTKGGLGAFEDDPHWEGYACPFRTWAACVNTTTTAAGCSDSASPCRACVSKRAVRGRDAGDAGDGNGGNGGAPVAGDAAAAEDGGGAGAAADPTWTTGGTITCALVDGQLRFHFPAGGIFPVTEQFTLPPNTAIVGARNPNNASGAGDKRRQQTDVAGQTWFVVPRGAALCGDDPMCKNASARAPTACRGDPRTHRQGFLMSSNSSLVNINFQGADLGRAASEGPLCGPGAIELPGCLSGDGCDRWGSGHTMGHGVVDNVEIRNVRLSDAVKRADLAQMGGDCRRGEALDSDGNHVRAHQISVWVAKVPETTPRSTGIANEDRGATSSIRSTADATETTRHTNILIDNLVSMNSRADGFNVHGAVRNLTLQNSHIENSGDDCIGVWSTGIEDMVVRNMTAANCAVTAGAQGNWGSCMGTYAFTSLAVDGLRCYDPFLSTAGCNARTHFTAIHLNKAFDKDCMPTGASLSLAGVEYFASASPGEPLQRAKCGQCRSCCGSCSAAGFDNLTVTYVDGSVPGGECMKVSAGC